MTKKTIISLIAAMSKNRAIGLNNALPWNPIPADWDNLKEVTKDKRMIMGRKSYDNPHRIWSEVGNYVITRQADYEVDEGFEVASSL
jgi:dihydrofolate reductase